MEAVIFDMDGVIFDSERACFDCWNGIADKWGLHDIEPVFMRCIGTNYNQTKQIVEEAYCGEFGEGIAEKLLKESSRIYHARYDGNALPVKKGVSEILKFLKDRCVRTGLASSTKLATVEAELKEAGLYNYFDSIIGGDAVVISKPDPEIYYLACRDIGVEPCEAIAIEDSYNGVRSAHAAGMHTIMVPDMIPADDEMRSLADIVCEDLIEAMRYLEELTGKTDT